MLRRDFALTILLGCCASLRYNPLEFDLEKDRLEGNATTDDEVGYKRTVIALMVS